MFIDKEGIKKAPEDIKNQENFFQDQKKNTLYWVIIFFCSIFAIGIIFVVYLNSNYYIDSQDTVLKPHKSKEATSSSVLPSYFSDDNPQAVSVLIPDDLKAEDLFFGSFYEESKEIFSSTLKKFSLPINVKDQVVNYYDLSRKIKIDNKIDELNKNAFAFLDDKAETDNDDFFSTYRYLLDNEIPIFISSDFIRYYNQNVLKIVYREIEKNVFYENLWDIVKKLYDISLARYQDHLKNEGEKNNVLLEGKRLETAFLAVALELLKPKPKQINKDESFANNDFFSLKEAQIYYFNIPRDLERDVQKEVSLIEASQKKAVSPIFLYEKDYTSFSLPEKYSLDAKLKNYFLAKIWLNAFFPLYYKSSECPNCFLDYNDWLNNFAAVNFLAKDFEENQDLKNRWAFIYKFIAFFEGLRSDLTYLHLSQKINEIFPDNDFEEKFFSENDLNQENIKIIQNALSQISFLPIEGGIEKKSSDKKNEVGIKFLQDSFWPDDYIFSQLNGEDLLLNKEDAVNLVSACPIRNNSSYYRCTAFSGDILKLHNFSDGGVNQKNFAYSSYDKKLIDLKEQLEKFDLNTWNSNIYWMDFSLSNTLIKNNQKFTENLSLNDAWFNKKIANEVLGLWINSSLEFDEWETYKKEKNQNLGFVPECSLYSYVEPQVDLYVDMIERNKMLLKAIEVMRVEERTNVASLAIFDLNDKLTKFLQISQKELLGERINEEECSLLKEIVSGINVVKSSSKEYIIKSKEAVIRNNLKKPRLLAFIKTDKEGKKSLVVGPVFDILEKK